MEFAIAAALVAALIYAARPKKPADPGSSDGSGSGQGQGNTTPPQPAGPLPPGVYPAGTPGAIPIVLYVQGGDNDSLLYATPGSYAGPLPPKTVTVWYGPGTRVTFQAKVDPGLLSFFSLTAFDHFEGPGGVTTKQNPFTQEIRQTGYVRAVFSWLGRVGG